MKVYVWSVDYPEYKKRMRAIRAEFLFRMAQECNLSLIPKE